MSESIDNLLNGQIQLPSVDDKLFVEAEDWWMNACLDWYHDPSELYIAGYKEAADALVDVVASRNGTSDSLVFPIVFLYRQYIELRLKSLLQDGRRLLGRENKEKPEHQLLKLWYPVKEILEEIWPDGDVGHIQAVDSLIKQFEKADPRSTSFRYPKDLDGNKSVNLEEPRINLRNLADVIGAMSIILEGAAGGISEYQSYKDDMPSDI